ncbi:glycosyltransferase family 2 protein [Aliivibrio fischeri]|uniref:glycosyltransferase family 2 protein n=1 Tax=Aliivibrio fischeri TaxID=668 RepID=UPI0007C4C0D7|nr:glycosyltransferase family 2 protein [Aliivibrio fischeri]
MIKVSIIIPAYNVDKYIERCVRSAIEQTLNEIEIIIVNDGSTDTTKKIIERLAKKDERIKVINKSNGGLSSARNVGIQVARGEYIQHLDGDDWIEKNACESIYKYAIDNKLDLVVTDIIYDDDEGNIKYVKELDSGIYLSDSFFKYTLIGLSSVCCWNKLIKRKLYEDILIPEHISYGEDLSVIPILIIKSKEIGKLDSAFLHYIYNPKSITNASAKIKGYQVILACLCIKEYLINIGRFDEFKYEYDILFRSRISKITNNEVLSGNRDYDTSVYNVIEFIKNDISSFESVKRYGIFFIVKYLPFKYVFTSLIALRNKIKMFKLNVFGERKYSK